jgi:hypothetical protein
MGVAGGAKSGFWIRRRGSKVVPRSREVFWDMRELE